MGIDIFLAAKILGELKNWSISHNRFQKILYAAHMFYIGNYQGLPLINSHFEAWEYGPVQSELYHEFKWYKAGPVRDTLSGIHVPFYESIKKEIEMINAAAQLVSRLNSSELEHLTMAHGGAWHKAYEKHINSSVIRDDDIYSEYLNRFSASVDFFEESNIVC